MKRTILILAAIIIGLSMSAQIQNKFLGFTLGSTTKSEIYNKYKNAELLKVDEMGDISVGNLVFADTRWDFTTFNFYNNILYSVQFSLSEELTSLALMNSAWDSFNTKLWNKYSDYYIANNSTSEMKIYIDGKIGLSLFYMGEPFRRIMGLQYLDINLYLQRSQAADDEL